MSGSTVMDAEQRARMSAASVLDVPAEAIEARLLASRPGRDVYVLEAAGERVIAKCYPDEPRTRAGGENLARFGGDHGLLVVPRCLKIDPQLRVVVMTRVPGLPLPVVLDGAKAAAAIARAGRAVAALHALPVQLATALARAELIAGASLVAVARADRAHARTALDEAAALLGAAPATGLVPSHGDLGPAQILCGERVGIVDFDRALMAEPGLDLGNLLAQLARKRGTAGGLLFDRLIGAYATAARPPTPVTLAPADDAATARSVAVGYALLVLVRKLAWLPVEGRPPVRAAIDTLVTGSHPGRAPSG